MLSLMFVDEQWVGFSNYYMSLSSISLTFFYIRIRCIGFYTCTYSDSCLLVTTLDITICSYPYVPYLEFGKVTMSWSVIVCVFRREICSWKKVLLLIGKTKWGIYPVRYLKVAFTVLYFSPSYCWVTQGSERCRFSPSGKYSSYLTIG